MSEENYNTLPEDYFIRDFPYHVLENLHDKEIQIIMEELDKIKCMTRCVDTSQCCLTEIITKENSYEGGQYMGRTYGVADMYNICTAFYIPENESVYMSIVVSNLAPYMKQFYAKGVKFPNNSAKMKQSVHNNIYTSPINISRILDTSRNISYVKNIRDIESGIGNTKLDTLLHRIKYGEGVHFTDFDLRNCCTQMRKKDIFHNFGDKEIIVDNIKYIRCDVFRPYLHFGKLYFTSTIKIYKEWLNLDIAKVNDMTYKTSKNYEKFLPNMTDSILENIRSTNLWHSNRIYWIGDTLLWCGNYNGIYTVMSNHDGLEDIDHDLPELLDVYKADRVCSSQPKVAL